VRVFALAASAAIALGAWSAGLRPASAELRLDTVNLVACAHEGGVCRMPHPTNVYYGVPGKTNGRPFPNGGSIACNTQTFGDPAPGQPKSCWYAPRITEGGNRVRDDDDLRRRDDRPRYDDRSRYDDRDRRDAYRDYDRPRRAYDDEAPPRRRYRSDPDDE
jgi:hypothetical protein